MRFKTDENLPDEFSELLHAAGWDARTVVQQQLGGTADPDVASVCTAESRTLITLDIGFGNIKAYPPGTHAGIIVLRRARQDKAAIVALAARVIDALRAHPIQHELWVVDDQKIRIRR